jgi:hypothetical protein
MTITAQICKFFACTWGLRRFLRYNVEPELLVAGDPGRLEQVLLTNAVKFSPPGSPPPRSASPVVSGS